MLRPFRLSPLLIAAALADEIRLDEVSSLLQEAKPIQTSRRDEKPLAGLLESARGFLVNGATDDVVTFAEKTLELVTEQVIPAIISESVADKKWMDTEWAKFGTEAQNLETTKTNVLDSLAQAVTRDSNLHKECRRREAGYCKTKTECETALYDLWVVWHGKEKDLEEKHNAVQTSVCGIEVSTGQGSYITRENETLNTFRGRFVQQMQAWVNEEDACETAEEAYTLKRPDCIKAHQDLDGEWDECNRLQGELEQSGCDHAAKVHETLDNFHREWSRLHKSYQGITDLVYTQTEDRLKEYRTLAVVKCLLDQIREQKGHPCDENTGTADEKLNGCEREGWMLDICADMPEICIDYKAPPSRPTLPPPVGNNHPCTSDWESTHMENLFTPAMPGSIPFTLPEGTFTPTNPGCNEAPVCFPPAGYVPGDTLEADRGCAQRHDWLTAVSDPNPTWQAPPERGSGPITHAQPHFQESDETALNYAHHYNLAGATVDGCRSQNTISEIPLTEQLPDHTAAVRCCWNDGSTCVSKIGTDTTCNTGVTFRDAMVLCEEHNMRLCTQNEMEVKEMCCDTGCAFDNVEVWISDGARQGSEVAWQGSHEQLAFGATCDEAMQIQTSKECKEACEALNLDKCTPKENGGIAAEDRPGYCSKGSSDLYFNEPVMTGVYEVEGYGTANNDFAPICRKAVDA